MSVTQLLQKPVVLQIVAVPMECDAVDVFFAASSVDDVIHAIENWDVVELLAVVYEHKKLIAMVGTHPWLGLHNHAHLEPTKPHRSSVARTAIYVGVRADGPRYLCRNSPSPVPLKLQAGYATGNMWSAESGSFWIVIMLRGTPAALYAATYLDAYSASRDARACPASRCCACSPSR